MLLSRLAYRSLWRNRRRTLLTMTAIGFATALVVLTLSVYEGIFQDLIEGATAYQGQIRVTAPGYFENPSLDLTVPQDSNRQVILESRGIRGAAGRVRGYALLSYGEGDSSHTQPTELLGIHPVEERGVSAFENRVIMGKFLSGPGTKEIVLGKGLARSLEAVVGGEIVVMGQDVYGSVAADILRVAGIVDTGDPLRDVSLALVGRETLQNILVLEGNVHEYAVSIGNPSRAAESAAEVRRRLPRLDVRPWNVFLPQLNDILQISSISRFIFALIFYFAVILVTVNTLYMSLLERMREFAVMAAVGLRPIRLSLMILLEGLFMSGMAGIAGGAAGVLASVCLQQHPVDLSSLMPSISYAESTIQPRLRGYVTADTVLVPVLMIVMLGSIVSLFPAWRLHRLRPVNILREV